MNRRQAVLGMLAGAGAVLIGGGVALAHDRGGARGRHAMGQIEGIAADGLTITTPSGERRVLRTDADTRYQLDGVSIARGQLAAGQYVHAHGASDAAGAFTASQIDASTSPPAGRRAWPSTDIDDR